MSDHGNHFKTRNTEYSAALTRVRFASRSSSKARLQPSLEIPELVSQVDLARRCWKGGRGRARLMQGHSFLSLLDRAPRVGATRSTSN